MATYDTYIEYLRREAPVEITEQGTYKKGEVPEDYSGAVLSAKVLYEVILARASGEVLQQVYNPEPPLDKTGNKISGIKFDGQIVKEGDAYVECVTSFNKDLPNAIKAKIKAVLKLSDKVGKGDA